MTAVPFRDVHYSSEDGLRLYARQYGQPDGGVPVLCLPGLTRNSKDFEDVAPRLAASRQVICPDFRGRGRSQYADDPSAYRPDVELADSLRLLDHLGVGKAAVIGTSRGGIVALIMAAKARHRMAGVLLNDIGPHIDQAGLLRIRSYLGGTPQFTSWRQAEESLAAIHPGFDTLTPAQWAIFARRVFREENGLPRADYDSQIAVTFPSAEDIAAGKVPDLWPLLALMSDMPVTVLRGEHSDLLSAATVQAMQDMLPGLHAVTIANRGHVPFLDEPDSLGAIDTWLSRVDATEMAPRTTV